MNTNVTDISKITWMPVPQNNDNEKLITDITEPATNLLISKTPITAQDMKRFALDPDGFRKDTWWDGLAVSSKRWDQEENLSRKYANNMNWYTAVAFSRWLGNRLSQNIRLPAEAELTKAAALIEISALSEWCINEFDDPDTVDLTSGLHKAVRGNFGTQKEDASQRLRNAASPINAYAFVGFRVVRKNEKR